MLADLVKLGVASKQFDKKIPQFVDKHETYHADSLCVLIDHKMDTILETELVSISMRKDLCTNCWLWNKNWKELAALHDNYLQATRLDIPDNVLDIRKVFRSFRDIYSFIRMSKHAFEPIVLENLHSLSTQRYEKLKKAIRSVESKTELALLVQAHYDKFTPKNSTAYYKNDINMNEYVAMTVPYYVMPDGSVEEYLYDAIVASYWKYMPVLGNFVLVIPKHFEKYLYDTEYRNIALAAKTTCKSASVDLQDENDPRVELAAALWQPKSDGIMKDFREAFKAASLF